MSESKLITLIEEYKICVSEANRVESLIWKSSGMLGIFSGVGLSVKLMNIINNKEGLTIYFFISIILITAFIVWLRLLKRWTSIQHLKYRRIDFIENEIYTNFGYLISQNQIVHQTDDIKLKELKYKDSILPKVGIKEKHIYGYEYRGIIPLLKFFIWINVFFWITIVVWILYQIEYDLLKMSIYTFLVIYSFILFNSYNSA